jgi:homoserine dehydrogenase
LRVALIGFGNVGRALARLLEQQRTQFPFPIVGIHTAHHGTTYDRQRLPVTPVFGEGAKSVSEFLDRARPDVAIEITTLSPVDGEPAISHIRAAFARGIHAVTANKGPIAHAYAALREEAKRAQVEFRFESTVMDGAPVFNLVRNSLSGVRIKGFTGVLNSTSKLVVAAMQRGLSMAEGIAEAQRLGIAEADASFDIDGWDAAAKTAALANVLMDASVRPQDVSRKGIGNLTTEEAVRLASEGKTVMLVSRAELGDDGALSLRLSPEVLLQTDMLATVQGTSNILLLHTDLMGTVGTVSISPGVEQTAYGLFSDLVDIAKSV